MMVKDQVCVGAIAGAFGVKGEVRLKSFCADPMAIAEYGLLSTEDRSQNFTVKIHRAVKNGFSATLSGVSTKEQADALRGTQLFVDRSNLPGLETGEYYHADLIDLAVFDTGGTALGHIKAVQNNGAGDLLEIVLLNSSETVLVPFTLAAVPTVDIAVGRVVLDPPEGLFSE